MKSLIPIVSVLLSAMSMGGVAEPFSEEFAFSESVAIYHMVENGAVIYARPDEYDENQGFIKVYEVLDQYLAELENPADKAFLPSEEKPVVGEFMLVNRDSEKKYFLREGWLGDGKNWVPMDGSDYETLWSVVDGRRSDSRSVTSTEELAAYTARVREATELDGTPGPAAPSESGRAEDSLKETVTDENTAFRSKTAKVESGGKSPPRADEALTDEMAKAEVHAQSPGVAQAAQHSVKIAAEQGSSDGGVAFWKYDDQDASPSRGEITQGQDHEEAKAWIWIFPSILLGALFLFFSGKGANKTQLVPR